MKTFDNNSPDITGETVQVGFSEYVTAVDGQTIEAYGLGSCVGIILRDTDAGVGGMAVAVLPSATDGADSIGAKYADSATSELLEDVIEQGGRYENVEALLVGGATIIEFPDLETDIGSENVTAARDRLANVGVSVVDTDVGGEHGRVVRFDTATGAVRITRADNTTYTIQPE